MISEARRKFLRGAAAVPLLGAFVSPAAAVNGQSLSGAASIAVSAAGSFAPFGAWGTSMAAKVGKPLSIWRLMRRAFHRDQDEYNASIYYREGPFDPNVAACRSWSHAYRSGIQASKDRDVQKRFAERRLGIYGDDDD